ncbi:MAG: integration host factor subunit alpha [Desulfobacteraceae bacterium]|nr:integration host factor subunit alpha [Desulfobacteraceae bacterium]
MVLTKAQIINDIYESFSQDGYSKKQCVDLLETLLEIMKSTMEKGEDVLISGFGKFCVREKDERKGRNPATGEDLMLRPRKVVTFRCSGKLKEKINRKEITD